MTDLIRPAPPSSRQLLARVLDDPALVAAVQQLEPRALARLVDHVGLEDAGELIALASTEQLVGVLDEDLWRSDRPGHDEAFDAARFLVWLEVLVEAGAAVAARRLAELPEDLVVHALHQHALVVDLDQLAVEVAELGDDADGLEKALEGCLNVELDAYRVMARRHDGWDALATVLVALDEQHHDVASRVLERCAALSARDVDDGGGLYEVLTSEDTLAGDVAGDREDRRAREGFLAPSQAAAFLRLAATTDLAAGPPARDPVSRAYFRELAPVPRPPASVAGEASRLAALLRDAGVLDDGPARPPSRARLPGAGDDDARLDLADRALREALADLAGRDPALHGRRLAELAYLANVLVAGADAGERSFRPAEAAAAAVSTCGLGLAHLVDGGGGEATDVLAATEADRLFRLGWRLLADRTGDPARALLGLPPRPPKVRPPAGRR